MKMLLSCIILIRIWNQLSLKTLELLRYHSGQTYVCTCVHIMAHTGFMILINYKSEYDYAKTLEILENEKG